MQATATIQVFLLLSVLTTSAMGFISAHYVTFLNARGLDVFQVNLVNLVYFLTMALAEVPTGAIADVFGRKVSFLCYCALVSLSLWLYGRATTLAGFAVAEFIAAIGTTCCSGAFQAWLVDQTRFEGYEGSLTGVFARREEWTAVSSIVGALIGTRLAVMNVSWPWFGGAIVMGLSGLVALILMCETYPLSRRAHLRDSLDQLRVAVSNGGKLTVRSGVCRFLLWLTAVQAIAFQAPNMQWQPVYATLVGGSVGLGYLWAGISLAMLLGARTARQLRVGDEARVLLCSQFLTGICLVIAVPYIAPVAITAFLGHEFGRGLFRPIRDAYINDHIPSSERATVLSYQSLAFHAFGALGLIVSGWLAKQISISFVWFLSGGLLCLSSLGLFRRPPTQT